MADVANRDSLIGLSLALGSSAFIGSSFIIKKKGLRKAAASGTRAGAGGYGYLQEPLWWAGFLSMALGEVANFAAYAFAPAILVTPLGALSIIFSAVLAHYLLNERLNLFGVVGCLLCIVGSTSIVLHAPPEHEVASVSEVFELATQPLFSMYTLLALSLVMYLIFHVAPRSGTSNIFVYLAICSVVGSFSVTSCKALGIAIKLTLQGNNQLVYPETYAFTFILVTCITTQMNYLNKSLDLFNTAVVSPIYYVMFTTSTITASMAMFKTEQGSAEVLTELCGFLTIICGTFILHVTKDLDAATLQQIMSNLTRPKDAAGPGLEGEPLLATDLGAPVKGVAHPLPHHGRTDAGPAGALQVQLASMPSTSPLRERGAVPSSRGPASAGPAQGSITAPSQRKPASAQVDEESGHGGAHDGGGGGAASAGGAALGGSTAAARKGFFW